MSGSVPPTFVLKSRMLDDRKCRLLEAMSLVDQWLKVVRLVEPGRERGGVQRWPVGTRGGCWIRSGWMALRQDRSYETLLPGLSRSRVAAGLLVAAPQAILILKAVFCKVSLSTAVITYVLVKVICCVASLPTTEGR